MCAPHEVRTCVWCSYIATHPAHLASFCTSSSHTSGPQLCLTHASVMEPLHMVIGCYAVVKTLAEIMRHCALMQCSAFVLLHVSIPSPPPLTHHTTTKPPHTHHAPHTTPPCRLDEEVRQLRAELLAAPKIDQLQRYMCTCAALVCEVYPF